MRIHHYIARKETISTKYMKKLNQEIEVYLIIVNNQFSNSYSKFNFQH